MGIVPRTFLYFYSLQKGAIVVAILKIIAAGMQFILTLTGAIGVRNQSEIQTFPWREACAYLYTAVFYCLVMVLVSAWFIWGIVHKKASVVLCWVVVACIWVAQTVVFLIVLINMYYPETSLATFITCQILGLIIIAIFIYSILVGYGFYKELKRERSGTAEN